MTDILALSLISIVVVTSIILLILMNKKDKKRLNPDSEIAIEEAMMDLERRRDKI